MRCVVIDDHELLSVGLLLEIEMQALTLEPATEEGKIALFVLSDVLFLGVVLRQPKLIVAGAEARALQYLGDDRR